MMYGYKLHHQWVLETVRSGLKFDFTDTPVCKNMAPSCSFNENEKDLIYAELQKLLKKQVIQKLITLQKDAFVSSVFTRPKQDGTHRMILNLKNLNKFVTYKHCKLESLQDVLEMVTPGVWMASVDLKDAYYTIPIHTDFRKFLTLIWGDSYYEYTCLPNGYAQALRAFTKVLKKPFGFLRQRGYTSVVYVDDSYLQGDTFQHCLKNITLTVYLLRSLGFTIHPEKSVLIPTQKLKFLGFIIDSLSMTISLAPKKREKIYNYCRLLLSPASHTIRQVSSTICCLVAVCPAVKYGRLFYRNIEICKNIVTFETFLFVPKLSRDFIIAFSIQPEPRGTPDINYIYDTINIFLDCIAS